MSRDVRAPEYSLAVARLYGDDERVAVAAPRGRFVHTHSKGTDMARRTIHALKKSNYLTRADVDPAVVVTVREVTEEEMKTQAGTETKFVVYFDELEKGLVLNWINGQTIAKILGSEDMDDWPGGKIVLYDDPNVSFGGQLVGGIRVRAPRKTPAAAPKPAPAAEPEFDDEIPFGDDDEAAA